MPQSLSAVYIPHRFLNFLNKVGGALRLGLKDLDALHNLFEVEEVFGPLPRVASELATLGFVTKPRWGLK